MPGLFSKEDKRPPPVYTNEQLESIDMVMRKLYPKLNSKSPIPVFTKEELNHIDEADNRAFYIYTPEKYVGKRASKNIAKILYQYGAILINKGYAYTKRGFDLINSEATRQKFFEGAIDENKILPNQQVALQYYYSLPLFTATNGDEHTADNPLQAIFVIIVALDHLPKNVITLLDKRLHEITTGMSHVPYGTIVFPNESCFLEDHATKDIIAKYNYKSDQHYQAETLSTLGQDRSVTYPLALIYFNNIFHFGEKFEKLTEDTVAPRKSCCTIL